MGIKATIIIDDDRWAKHPYGVKFDDEKCNQEFYTNGVDSREQCYRVIDRARAAGYDIDSDIEEYFYQYNQKQKVPVTINYLQKKQKGEEI